MGMPLLVRFTTGTNKNMNTTHGQIQTAERNFDVLPADPARYISQVSSGHILLLGEKNSAMPAR